MSLKNILADVVADVGGSTSNDSEKAIIVKRINDAAEEIYNCEDLSGSLREQVFDLNTDTQQISLPNYVGEIRGMRYYDARLKITLNDMMPRYHYGLGNEVWPLKYRVLTKSPLATFITNQSVLKVTSPLASLENFTVTIVGSTPNSSVVRETLNFSVGDLTKTTVANFETVVSITKSSPTTYDLIVSDVEDTELARIPNAALNSEYIIVQVLDFESTNPNTIEVLYKHRLFPFVNEYDEFPAGSAYDKAIYWKYLEHEAARNKDVKGSVAAMQKATQIIRQVAENIEAGLEKVVDAQENTLLSNPSVYAFPLNKPLYCG